MKAKLIILTFVLLFKKKKKYFSLKAKISKIRQERNQKISSPCMYLGQTKIQNFGHKKKETFWKFIF